jgi:protein-L-isoaspartate(D-aspartate) O-methyltransferase
MVQALELKETDSVLDIGAANGYGTAVLSRLAQSVVGIEKDPEMARVGQQNLTDHDVDNAIILESDLASGLQDEAPYNAIIIEGGIETVPDKILEQLNDDGRLIAILRPNPSGPGRAVKYVRSGGGFAHTVLFDANTPVLDEFITDRGFDFGG